MNELRCYILPVSCKQSLSSAYQLLLHSTWLYRDHKQRRSWCHSIYIYNICQSLHHLPVHPLFSINGFDLRIFCSGYWNNQDTHVKENSHHFFVYDPDSNSFIQYTNSDSPIQSTHIAQFPVHQTIIWQSWFFYNISTHFILTEINFANFHQRFDERIPLSSPSTFKMSNFTHPHFSSLHILKYSTNFMHPAPVSILIIHINRILHIYPHPPHPNILIILKCPSHPSFFEF